MMNAKDFMIEYESIHGYPPTEEEWLDYLDTEAAKIEALGDEDIDYYTKGDEHGKDT